MGIDRSTAWAHGSPMLRGVLMRGEWNLPGRACPIPQAPEMGIDRSTASAHGSPMLRVDAGGVESARARLPDPQALSGPTCPSAPRSDIVLPINRRMTLPFTTTLPVFAGAQEMQNDTERTARARGVSRGEPAESHAARLRKMTQTGRARCGRESSQGAGIRYAILSK